MLKYSIKLNDSDIEKKEIVWSEKFLASDLSYMTGVTSQDYHLEKYEFLEAYNVFKGINDRVHVSSENVTRQGFIVAKNKVHNVNTETVYSYDNLINPSGLGKIKYLDIDGVYIYANDNDEIVLTDWLSADTRNKEVVETEVTANVFQNGGIFQTKIDTVYWIEDGRVEIDGENFFYKRDESGLTYVEDGEILDSSAITNCDRIIYCPYSDPSNFKPVTKFTLTKEDEKTQGFDSMQLCIYFLHNL